MTAPDTNRTTPGAQRGAAPPDATGDRVRVRLGVGLRVPTLDRLVGVEVVVSVLASAAIAADVSPETVAFILVPLAVLPFVAVAGQSLFDWVVTAVRYATGSLPSVGVTTDHIDSDGIAFGVHRRGDLVSCILELRPRDGAITLLGRATATTDSTLDLAVLAGCLTQHDISLSGIDVVSHGRRTASGTPATDVYERLIGPLPAVADRTVWVTVTVDVRANLDAVRLRGGGHAGAAHTVHIAAERVARALSSQGIQSTTLTRNEIHAVVTHLCRGVAVGDLTQNWRSAPLPGVIDTGYGLDCRGIDGEVLADLWAAPSLSTTVALRVTPGSAHDRLGVSGSCNVVTRTAAPTLDVPGIVSMNGRHRQSILTSLPIAVAAPGFDDPRREIGLGRASALVLPTGGCGQLLGSDASGNGVAVRIHGPGLRTVLVAGELYLAQQVVFRAVATGARIVVRTDRPHAWGPLVDSVATPDRLRMDNGHHRAGAPVDLVVHDFSDALIDLPRSRTDGVTTLVLTEHPPRTPMRDPDVTIVQPGAAGDRVHIRTARRNLELALVTIAQETAFIGRPRSVRSSAVSY